MVRVGYAVPIPRRLLPSTVGQPSPLSNIVNLQSSVGGVGGDPTDYIGELQSRIQGDIKATKNATNTDVSGLINKLKSQQPGWSPPIPGLPAARYSVTGRNASQAPTGKVKLSGNIDSWIAQAYRILGIKLTPQALAHEKYLIQHESGGNPRAQNNWDSNAKKGTPSRGIAQVIDPTFARYKVAGHNDIWNPVDNLLASLQYRRGRYGSYDIGNYKGGY